MLCRKTCAHCNAQVQFFNITILILLAIELLIVFSGHLLIFADITDMKNDWQE
jgi:hypothetical protein